MKDAFKFILINRDEICPGDKTLYNEVLKTSDLGDLSELKENFFNTMVGERP
jgi:hypothetical protein